MITGLLLSLLEEDSFFFTPPLILLSRALHANVMPQAILLFTTNSAVSNRKPNQQELRRAGTLVFSSILLDTLLYSTDNIRFITIYSQIDRPSPQHLNSIQAGLNHTTEPSDPELRGLQSASELFDGAKKRVLGVYGREERKEKCDMFDGEWI